MSDLLNTVTGTVASEGLGGDSAPQSGERLLHLATFRDGILSVIKGDKADRAWMESEEESEPFSFVALCDLFDLDIGVVRHLIETEPERIKAEIGRL